MYIVVYGMGSGETMEKVYNSGGGQGWRVSVIEYGWRRRVEV
jgi:hypothetical protein